MYNESKTILTLKSCATDLILRKAPSRPGGYAVAASVELVGFGSQVCREVTMSGKVHVVLPIL